MSGRKERRVEARRGEERQGKERKREVRKGERSLSATTERIMSAGLRVKNI